MFLKSIVAVVLVLGASQASIIPIKDGLNQVLENEAVLDIRTRSEDVNVFLDEIFANLRYQMRQGNLTSLPLPPIEFEFSETEMGEVQYGEASITNGAVQGIDTIHRIGESDFKVEDNGDILVSVDAGVNDCSIGAALKVAYMGKEINAVISGTLKNLRLRVAARIRIGLDGIKAMLEELEIVNIGTITVKVSGLSIVGFLLQIVVQIVGNIVKDSLASALGGIIKDLLNSALQGLAYLFPVDEIIKAAQLASP